jgi:hypothetical protein
MKVGNGQGMSGEIRHGAWDWDSIHDLVDEGLPGDMTSWIPSDVGL